MLQISALGFVFKVRNLSTQPEATNSSVDASERNKEVRAGPLHFRTESAPEYLCKFFVYLGPRTNYPIAGRLTT